MYWHVLAYVVYCAIIVVCIGMYSFWYVLHVLVKAEVRHSFITTTVRERRPRSHLKGTTAHR